MAHRRRRRGEQSRDTASSRPPVLYHDLITSTLFVPRPHHVHPLCTVISSPGTKRVEVKGRVHGVVSKLNTKCGAQEAEEGRAKQVVLQLEQEARFSNPRIPKPETRIPNPESRIPKLESRIPNPEIQNPNPESRIPKHHGRRTEGRTRNPKKTSTLDPETVNPELLTKRNETRIPQPYTQLQP